MIGEQAKNSFSEMLAKGVEITLPNEEGQFWEVKPWESKETPGKGEFFIITISSLIFRVLITIHFEKNDKTNAFVAKKIGQPEDELEYAQFYDYLGEFANMFCGIIKRELTKCFPYLGMSTPDRLEESAFPYIHELKNGEYKLQLQAKDSATDMTFRFSLLACSFGDLDFTIEQEEEEEDIFGELELF